MNISFAILRLNEEHLVTLHEKDPEDLELDLYLVMADIMSLGVILEDKKREYLDVSFVFFLIY